jgi:uncharacterized membrane protein YedE/YeeE
MEMQQMNEFILPLIGGGIIGIAVSLMLLLNGRVTGVSGIVSGTLKWSRGDLGWRVAFILGLIFGGYILSWFNPTAFTDELDRSLPVLVIAGLLVGYGTVLGSGCTSGHGICGISRMSPRSIASTLVFISAGILVATLFRILIGGS